jgi:hypothetical protein
MQAEPSKYSLVDRTFKWALIVVAGLFIAVFWQYSQNGRYTFVHGTEDSPAAVIGTRTGEVTFGRAIRRPN